MIQNEILLNFEKPFVDNNNRMLLNPQITQKYENEDKSVYL